VRQYKYEVGDGSDIDAWTGQKTYVVLCRSWDSDDPDRDAWVRVVNWYTDRTTAQREADAYQAISDEARIDDQQCASDPDIGSKRI